MKKYSLIAMLVFTTIVFGSSKTFAQIENAQASTTVLISVNDFVTIDVESMAIGGLVAFNYVTADDYKDTKTENVPNSLIVSSSRSFGVLIKADGANFTDGINHIPVDVLTIKPAEGGTMSGIPKSLVLSTDDQTLVGVSWYGISLRLNLDYEIPAAKASSDILGKPPGNYIQTVTYTAVPL